MAGNEAVAAAEETCARAVATGERETLEAFLDYLRVAVAERARGVSEADARTRRVASDTTIGGLVKHLLWVEADWFQRVLAQVPEDQLAFPWTEEDPDADYRLDDAETLPMIIAGYEDECARSRETAAAYDLDTVVPHRHLGQVSLRWILVHMIEETGRHAGHLDILREQTDGLAGDA